MSKNTSFLITNLNSTFKWFFLFSIIYFNSCATYNLQQSNNLNYVKEGEKTISHTFYVAGGMGNLIEGKRDSLFLKLKAELKSSDKASTLLFTGDNVSSGIDDWEKDKSLIEKQYELISEFNGETIFIPGNNEWKDKNSNQVEKIENFIKNFDNDRVKFLPKNACPLERISVNDQIDLILIDSKWFISNWSRLIDINKKCSDINTRRRFVEELEGFINDGQDKNIVLAMHHPIFSNGVYSGNKSMKDHLFPIPVLGSLIQGVEDLGAFSPDQLNQGRYNLLRVAVSAIAQSSDRITVISGHEENLQYLYGGGIHQVIGGSLTTSTPTNRSSGHITAIGGSLAYKGKYTHGSKGFAKLLFYSDGSSSLQFYEAKSNAWSKTFGLVPKFLPKNSISNDTNSLESITRSSVLLNKNEFDKNGLHRFFWGNRFRSYYGKKVSAKVVSLDTLYGGLKVIKEGGGHQSFSLRLEDKTGKEYAMRSLKKNALKFLKFKLPGIAYSQDDYKDTFAEDVISDFFTSAHPYMQLVINPMAQAVGINHSDSELVYVPMQTALSNYQNDFGDQLYFVERRPSEEQLNYKGYRRSIQGDEGKVNDFESTTDMLEKIKSDESYVVDQRNFIRARIFDMLIGDWDRHQDQWRWIEFKGSDGIKEFMPIPRDRDNAFPKFDGFAMNMIRHFVPESRSWQSYDKKIRSIKWLNLSGNSLDRALLTKYGVKEWVEEAKVIQQNLTNEVINKAFLKIPPEVRDQEALRIKRTLFKRLEILHQIAHDYASYLNKIVIIRGTEKDDQIEITRMENGNNQVVIKRLLTDEANKIIYERVFNSTTTKEIWIYGLGDDDVFNVQGTGNNIIYRIIGGYGSDEFNIANKKRIKVYDWKHEKSTFPKEKPRTQLSNLYKTNTYHWRYFKPSYYTIVPNMGLRTDDGLFLGVKQTFVKNGLNGNPFRQKHMLGVNYYFAFKAIEIDYKIIYGNIFPKWNFEIDSYYTSDKFSNSFYGFGNETTNPENDLGRDYNRARIQQFKISTGLAYYTLRLKAIFESYRVNETSDRFFTSENFDPSLFQTQSFVGGEISGYYKNSNAGDFPTKSLYFGFNAGYKANLRLNRMKFGYTSVKLGINHKLTSSGQLVLASEVKWKTNIGRSDFFFYHAPSLGGNNGLRGFRDERFSGKSFLYQSTDMKLKLKRYVTAVSPVTIGLYAGFDYGRVWTQEDISNRWYTSQGGGLWVSSLKALSFNLGYFNSIEGNIVQVGFGLSL